MKVTKEQRTIAPLTWQQDKVDVQLQLSHYFLHIHVVFKCVHIHGVREGAAKVDQDGERSSGSWGLSELGSPLPTLCQVSMFLLDTFPDISPTFPASALAWPGRCPDPSRCCCWPLTPISSSNTGAGSLHIIGLFYSVKYYTLHESIFLLAIKVVKYKMRKEFHIMFLWVS